MRIQTAILFSICIVAVCTGIVSAAAPIANFEADNPAGWGPTHTVYFHDLSANSPTSWYWEFGDGTTSTEQNPSHLYNACGSYTVNLTATNDDGSDTYTVQEGYVFVNWPFLDGFQYRMFHEIIPDSPIEDYPVKFIVHRDFGDNSSHDEHIYINSAKINADYSDLRFEGPDGLLDYWIESYDESQATVWVKYREASPEGMGVIISYGNPSAPSLSDGEAVFPFFDDFEGTELDTGKWTSSGSVTVADSNVTMICNGGVDAYIASVSGYDTNHAIRARLKSKHFTTSSYREALIWYGSTGNIWTAFSYTSSSYGKKYNVYDGSSYSKADITGWSADEYHVFETMRDGSNSVKFTVDDTNLQSLSTSLPTGAGIIKFISYGNDNSQIDVDWVFVTPIDSTITHGDYTEEQEHFPWVWFNGTPTRGYYPLGVQFYDLTSGDVDNWFWDFGDGYTSTEQNPYHLYDEYNTGGFTVSLLAWNSETLSEMGQYERPSYIILESEELNCITVFNGWNFVSVPTYLKEGSNNATIFDVVDRAKQPIYTFNGETKLFEQLDSSDSIIPLNAYWVYSRGFAQVPLEFNDNPVTMPPSKDLFTGWNAIGTGNFLWSTADRSLASIEGKWSALYRYDTVETRWWICTWNDDEWEWYGMQPAAGHYIWMNENATLVSMTGGSG